jgi:predicted nuclease with TOPRIM domain
MSKKKILTQSIVMMGKLREGRKQYIHDLNSLQTEKSSLLRKIQELEEKILETQLQLERLSPHY